MKEEQLEKAFPWIPWRTSIAVSRLGHQLQYRGCRYCIVMKGLKEQALEQECFETEDEFNAHMEGHLRKDES